MSIFMGTRLLAGVHRRHLATFYVAAFATIFFAVGYNAVLPFFLVTFLGLPVSQHGGALGTIGFASEVVLFATVSTFGALSDRTGRRFIYASGFVVLALAFAVTPLARTLPMLVLARALFSVGIAAATAMLATIVADYVQNADRGKANAIMGIMNGLGASMAAVGLAKVPSLLTRQGWSGLEAGIATALLVGLLCLVMVLIVGRGLQAPSQSDSQARRPDMPVATRVREGIRAAREPGVALSYLAAFAARADLAVAGLFFPAWLTRHFVSALDTTADASALDAATTQGIAAGGALVAIAGASGLLFAPVIGIMCDRVHRPVALSFGLCLNVIGYGLAATVTDPTTLTLKLAAMLIGFGQVGGIIASQVLIQEQAPVHARGAVVGAFGTSGALGIMTCLFFGGQLFDHWRATGPFALVAGINAVVVVIALLMSGKIKRARLVVEDGGVCDVQLVDADGRVALVEGASVDSVHSSRAA